MPNPNRPAEEAERSAVAVEVVVARGAAEVVTFVCNSLVTPRILQSGAVYLSLDFVILFCLSCEGLIGQ